MEGGFDIVRSPSQARCGDGGDGGDGDGGWRALRQLAAMVKTTPINNPWRWSISSACQRHKTIAMNHGDGDGDA